MKSPFENAMELSKVGIKLVPVHNPQKIGEVVVCSCHLGAACRSIGKHPIPKTWTEAASDDQNSLKAWWSKFKKANLGVVAGSVSGIVVMDIDPRNGGDESLDDLQAKYGKLPDTATVITGSGGQHIYFKHPGGAIKNSAGNLGAGIDLKADGGFVVGPGSLHACGAYYDWEASSHPEEVGFAQMPDWLMKLVYAPPRKPQSQVETGAVIEGARNVWLASLAGAIRRKGCGYRPIFAALYYANKEMCSPPLERDELEIIAKSIARYPL